MKGFYNQQIWLTAVLTNDQVPSAMVLYKSLKKSISSYPVGVIVSLKVSPHFREALNACFDQLFYLDEDQNVAEVDAILFSTLFAFTLRSFKKCVVLSPSMLALKNCDDLFDYDDFQGFLPMEGMNMSIVVVHPSLETFKQLMTDLKEKANDGFHDYLNKWWINNNREKNSFINEQFLKVLSIQSGMMIGNEKDLRFVNIVGDPVSLAATPQHIGLLGEYAAAMWIRIFEEEVKPFLNGQLPTSQMQEDHDAIAIVGMSCRYPGANNLEEFWKLLIEGRDGTGKPPPSRWLKEQSIRSGEDYIKTNAGFLQVPVDEFDSKFFGISPAEMLFLDPQHRLLLELIWEGVEDAAINPQTLRGSNGSVFMGSWMNDYYDILTHSGNNEFFRKYMGNSIGAAAARISFLLGLTGPSISTESGCSSAMVAVHLACKSLQRGETNMALACGVNLLLHPFDKNAMPMMVSPNGRSRTFDSNADGFARAEGTGVLVLKRLSDAVKEGDKVWGLIRGSAMCQEGISKSMGTPTVYCEALAMKLALKDAELDPGQVSYVEAHGTGTVVGDPMEIAAITKAYHSKERKEPLVIGSVKTNVGHTESCSGITGIMKVILAMYHDTIPPHLNFENLNPNINLDAVPAVIPLKTMPWVSNPDKPRYAGVSSFGITGTDAHVILEEASELKSGKVVLPENIERPLHILKLSAKTKEALDILLEKYCETCENGENFLADIAYTANIGRANFAHRAVVVGDNKETTLNILRQKLFMKGEVIEGKILKVCFLFTGQGSQYPGMANKLYDTNPVFRMNFDYCDKHLKENYNLNIKDVLWSYNSTEISRTIYSQTSIFCVEYALMMLWESWGVKPDYVLGHSLGEFAAAVCAGILSVDDALKLVTERSLLIDNLPRGKMLVIKADKSTVDSLQMKYVGMDSTKWLDYAAVNSTQQTVVAGDSHVIEGFAKFCSGENVKCILLEATHAFHSKHMDSILEKYRNIAMTVKKLNNATASYISGMRGSLTDVENVNADYWVQHTREKVSFLDASKTAVQEGCQVFIEIGPQPVLSALTMMNNDTDLSCLPSLKRNEDEWSTLLNSLGRLYLKGFEINWEGFDQFYSRRKVSLPHYPFIGKTFWPDMMAVTGIAVHPLIGTAIPNASSSKLFQNGFNSASLDFSKDHAIGNNVIFPGAGYLEMCLAAGLAAVENCMEFLPSPSRPMKVENLLIQAPLKVEESKTCQLQTIVEFNASKDNSNDWNDMNVKICRKSESDSAHDSIKWFTHAQATFTPLISSEEKQIPFDLTDFQQTISSPGSDKMISELYEKLDTIGLKFGPMFRSLEKVWENKDANTLVAKVKVPMMSEGQSQYILHPVVLDAMIQAVMMLKHSGKLKKKIFVPIKIGKFIWLSAFSSSDDLYIQVFDNPSKSSDSLTALLVTGNGVHVAVMYSIELIDTTVKAIEAVLEQQTISLPDMWDDVWRPKPGPLAHPVDTKICSGKFYDTEFMKKVLDTNQNPAAHHLKRFAKLEKFVYLNMLRGFYDCGWCPVLNHEFSEEDLIAELKIKQECRKYFTFILDVFEKENVLKSSGNKLWRIISLLPTPQKVLSDISSPEYMTDLASEFKSTLLFVKVGENLREILQGTKAALTVLFPDEKQGYPSAISFYTDMEIVFQIHNTLIEVAKRSNVHVKGKMHEKKFVVRILEVGAGTGSFTHRCIRILTELGIDYEWTFTDISAAFFPAAEKRFEMDLKNLKFKKLNIEEDPISQGFTPQYYDYICASDVIHATKDIRETLRNVRSLLKPHGRFDMFEMTRVNRFIWYLFGLLDGFWRFQDFDLRPRYCTLSKEKWVTVFETCGFNIIGVFPTMTDYHSFICVERNSDLMTTLPSSSSKCWIIFYQEDALVSTYLRDKIKSVGRNVVIVETDHKKFHEFQSDSLQVKVRRHALEDYELAMESISKKFQVEGIIYCWGMDKQVQSQEDILQPFFNLIKAIPRIAQKQSPKVVVITKSVASLADNDLSSFQASTLWGFTKTVKNENAEMNCRCIEMADDAVDEARLEEVFYEIWNPDKEIFVAYRGGNRYISRLQRTKPHTNDLHLPPGTDRFQLILPESKAIADLQFGSLESMTVKGNQVEIHVKASALNFRDVFSVLKPTEKFNDINAVGFDFAGVVKRVGGQVSKWKTGNLVFGVNVNGAALPSHVILSEDELLSVPDDMTLCEAATLPAVFATGYYCLIDVAKIRPSDVVLIHTASGGVGLSAIEICRHIGCTIITTAGSKRKQNYLRSLGIKHVFQSRRTDYGEEILKLTNGRGVDVVLNSLTSDGFKEATLKACAKGARFVEMSKLSIWQPEEVKELRPDVEYTIADVSTLENQEWRRLMECLKKLLEQKVVTPIPYVRFDGVNIREALQYLQKAKHIGKVVCVMPEVRIEDGERKVFTPMFNDRSSYLITGGLGGIGFEVCKWMVKSGAKHVLLAGRKPPSESIQLEIDSMNSLGANVIPVQVDIGNYEMCKDLLKRTLLSLSVPPLRGVMHCAGTLSDGLITNQEWSKFSSTFNTKVNGTLNMHELTKNMRLEHFVLYSSIAALFGTPSQGNHAAGNFFEDSMAHYRYSMGLPATTINWGLWGEVGIATELELPGVKPLSTFHGIAALEYILKSHRVQTAVTKLESPTVMAKILPLATVYLDERIWNEAGSSSSTVAKSEEFWEEYDLRKERSEKLNVLTNHLERIIRMILKLDKIDVIDPSGSFQEMGVDSLMFVEIKNSVQALFGDRVAVNASALRNCDCLQKLADTLVDVIEGEDDLNMVAPTFDEVSKLIREDALLPEHIFIKPEQKAKDVGNIETVLLTGVTGTLGPYLLRELLKLPQITSVFCLARPHKTKSLEERLTDILLEKNLLSEIDMRRVRCIPGNIAHPHLGLDNKVWDELTTNVDAVFHCAASVQHIEFYKARDPLSQKDTRSVNIQGTKNILEFACTNTLKQVYNASSIVGVSRADANQRFSELWQEISDFDEVTTFAYPVSKFVQDILMKQAVERGIPCKAIRLPYIIGDSKTGQFSLHQNHLMLRYLFILRNGVMPSNPLPMSILPVDICASASVELFFHPDTFPGVYNICHNQPDTDQEFALIAKRLGYDVGVIDFSEFAQVVKDNGTKEDIGFSIFKGLYETDSAMDMFTSAPVLKSWLEGENDKFWVSDKISRLLPNFYLDLEPSSEYLYRDLQYAIGKGWFRGTC